MVRPVVQIKVQTSSRTKKYFFRKCCNWSSQGSVQISHNQKGGAPIFSQNLGEGVGGINDIFFHDKCTNFRVTGVLF